MRNYEKETSDILKNIEGAKIVEIDWFNIAGCPEEIARSNSMWSTTGGIIIRTDNEELIEFSAGQDLSIGDPFYLSISAHNGLKGRNIPFLIEAVEKAVPWDQLIGNKITRACVKKYKSHPDDGEIHDVFFAAKIDFETKTSVLIATIFPKNIGKQWYCADELLVIFEKSQIDDVLKGSVGKLVSRLKLVHQTHSFHNAF